MILAVAALLLYVTNERAGTVSVIDTSTDTVINTIPVGTRPRGIVASGKKLYVAVSHFRDKPTRDRDGVVVIEGDRVAKRYDCGLDPEGIAMHGDRFVVANEDAGTASIVDVRNGKITPLVTGTEPEGVAISHDGRWAYVTAETSSTITVIDLKANRVATNFFVSTRPRYALFTRGDAHAYVSAEIGGAIDVVDAKKHRVVAKLKLGKSDHPVGMVLSRDEKRLYAATGRGNSVAVVDATTNRLIKEIAVGQRPWGMAITPDGKKIYAANSLSNDISVIDAATERVVRTIKVGDGPWGLAFSGMK